MHPENPAVWLRRCLFATMVILMSSSASGALDPGPVLRKEVRINAPLDAVWSAWTTEEGLRFLSNESRIELEIGGAYEWFLDLPADDDGYRGGQGAKVLAFLAGEMLAFDWTFPPDVPSLRKARAKTQVLVLFDEVEDGIKVRFAQSGWQEGEDWEAGYAYFDRAWDYVLSSMKVHLEAEGEPSP